MDQKQNEGLIEILPLAKQLMKSQSQKYSQDEIIKMITDEKDQHSITLPKRGKPLVNAGNKLISESCSRESSQVRQTNISGGIDKICASLDSFPSPKGQKTKLNQNNFASAIQILPAHQAISGKVLLVIKVSQKKDQRL